jgi:Protein of unknown function (DUF2798)
MDIRVHTDAGVPTVAQDADGVFGQHYRSIARKLGLLLAQRPRDLTHKFKVSSASSWAVLFSDLRHCALDFGCTCCKCAVFNTCIQVIHFFKDLIMRGMIHPRFAQYVFGALLSSIMVSVVTAVVILVNQGLHADFFAHWIKGVGTAWPVAFPTVLLVAPLVRRAVAYLTTPAV